MGFVQTFTTPPGTPIPAASVPAGEIAAVLIDNPSAAWLFLPSLREYVQPYTLGWARNLDVKQASFAVQFPANGPDGSPSVNLGDPIRLVLYDAATAAQLETYPGRQFEPVSRKRLIAGTMPVAASLTNLAFIGVDAGRRIGSIIVDNPSGAWLQLAVYGDYIPPNTIGWSKTLPDAPLTVTITAVATGPDGSPSIQLGDPPTVTLLDTLAGGNTPGAPYVPIARKESFVTVAFANFGVKAFTGANVGRLIAGIILDNPSGSWLTLVIGGATYSIAPYTLRWVKRIDPPTLQVTSMSFAAAGPAGQVSTLAGDQITLTILDIPPDSPDTAFIDKFTPVLRAIAFVEASKTQTALTALIAPIANQRIRILGIDFTYDAGNAQPSTDNQWDSPVICLIATNGGSVLFRLRIAPWIPYHDIVFTEGYDLTSGVGVSHRFSADFHNVAVVIEVSYQVI